MQRQRLKSVIWPITNIQVMQEFSGRIESVKRAFQEIRPEFREVRINSAIDMIDGEYDQLLHMESKIAVGIARKPGFEAELAKLGIKTPLFHTACAYSVVVDDKEKHLIIGRQSPTFKAADAVAEQDAKASPMLNASYVDQFMHMSRTEPSNEKNYALFGSHFLLKSSGVCFSGQEHVQVIEEAKQDICNKFNTFFTSNCYSFAMYCLTKYISLLDERHCEAVSQKDNILKLGFLLLEGCSDPLQGAQGICNNDHVRNAVYASIEILYKHFPEQRPEAHPILIAQPVENQPVAAQAVPAAAPRQPIVAQPAYRQLHFLPRQQQQPVLARRVEIPHVPLVVAQPAPIQSIFIRNHRVISHHDPVADPQPRVEEQLPVEAPVVRQENNPLERAQPEFKCSTTMVFEATLYTKVQSPVITGVNQGRVAVYVNQAGSDMAVPKTTLPVCRQDGCSWMAQSLDLGLFMHRDLNGHVQLNGDVQLAGKSLHFEQGLQLRGGPEELLRQAQSAEGLKINTELNPFNIHHSVEARLSNAVEVTEPAKKAAMLANKPRGM